MAMLGKSLVFYLKYPAEMNRLYWDPDVTGEDPDVEGLKEMDKVLSMIRKVGDAACREAASFLEACAERIDRHLQSVGTARRVRRKLEDVWEVCWRVSPKRHRKRSFALGVGVLEDIQAVIPWIWRKGGRQAADEVVRLLGRGFAARSTSDFAGWGSGTVVLDPIRITLPNGPQDFDMDQEPLVAKVCEAMTFKSEEIQAIARIGFKSGE